MRSSRRTLKDLQKTATDKENLTGRPKVFNDPKSFSDTIKPDARRKKPKVLMQNKAVQVGECTITADDLISDEPGADYWKCLAETKTEALNKSLEENEKLKENIEALQEENKICKEMLEESKHLVEVLQEMLQENDEETIEATTTDE